MYPRSKDSRTYADRSEYLKMAVAKRRRVLKQRAIEIMGGKCMVCGYGKHQGVLDFHHVDPSTKSFGVSSGGFSRSWAAIEAEIRKCILVCANCHREIELGLHNLEITNKLHTDFWNDYDVMNNSLAPGKGFEPST